MTQREPSQRLRGVVDGAQRAGERVEGCVEGRAVTAAGQVARERETPLTQSIRVSASHVGLGYSAAVMFLLADRLAQPDGNWKKFLRPRLGNLLLARARTERNRSRSTAIRAACFPSRN
jgi:hypothetical protein